MAESGVRKVHGVPVRGLQVDAETRCGHWHGPTDIIALRMYCCREWFPCFECHQALTKHEPEVWPVEQREALAILCGACGHTLSINEYMDCETTCPNCAASFNPGCATHYDLYFEIAGG